MKPEYRNIETIIKPRISRRVTVKVSPGLDPREEETFHIFVELPRLRDYSTSELMHSCEL